MSDMQTVGSGVKADVEGCFTIVDQFFDLCFIGHLGDQTAGNQFVINCHNIYPFFLYYLMELWNKKTLLRALHEKGRSFVALPPFFTDHSHDQPLSDVHQHLSTITGGPVAAYSVSSFDL